MIAMNVLMPVLAVVGCNCWNLLANKQSELVFFGLSPLFAAVVDQERPSHDGGNNGEIWNNPIHIIWFSVVIVLFMFWQDAESRAAVRPNDKSSATAPGSERAAAKETQ